MGRNQYADAIDLETSGAGMTEFRFPSSRVPKTHDIDHARIVKNLVNDAVGSMNDLTHRGLIDFRDYSASSGRAEMDNAFTPDPRLIL